MKKVLVLFATMVMSFALAVTVMANDSPSKETDSTGTDYTEQPSGTTTSPKTSDEGAPAALVYGALAAAAMSVYAARRLKEQYYSKDTLPPVGRLEVFCFTGMF